jgi:hypothetical protein
MAAMAGAARIFRRLTYALTAGLVCMQVLHVARSIFLTHNQVTTATHQSLPQHPETETPDPSMAMHLPYSLNASAISDSGHRVAARRRRALRHRYANTKSGSPFYPLAKHSVGMSSLPNILLMVADDLQPNDLKGSATPYIKSIASAGVAFSNAHTPSPLCTPSRFAILTGRHASCHFNREEASTKVAAHNDNAESRALIEQIDTNGTLALLPELPSIEFNINLPRTVHGAHGEREQQCSTPTTASYLAARGYATGFVGKWCAALAVSVERSHPDARIHAPVKPPGWQPAHHRLFALSHLSSHIVFARLELCPSGQASRLSITAYQQRGA